MRQTQLDGVRGIAILMVIADHHYLLSVGWAGVDLFFVLSGFLITRILLKNAARSSYWAPFYVKRAGRIFPALLLLFPFVFALSRHVGIVGLFGYVFFLGNYMNLTRYSAGLLVILWSLAIEEHFYLLWPFAIRYFSIIRNLQLLCAILLLEPILRLAATSEVSSYAPIYYMTWFRLDSITAGSLLALLAGYPRAAGILRRWSLFCSSITVAIFGTLWLIFGAAFTPLANSAVFNSMGYSLSSLSSFFLIAHLTGDNSSLIAKLLSFKPLVFIGRISYGMYLFHLIVLAITRRILHIGTGGAWITATRNIFLLDLALVILVAWLSFRFFEEPMIRWSKQRADSLELSPLHE
jgi:peptidoglycan/LPS O-acetylase OafA/YrhL